MRKLLSCYYKYKDKLATANKMEDIMNTTNKLTVPDLISIGVFTALYFGLVTIAPGFNKENEH